MNKFLPVSYFNETLMQSIRRIQKEVSELTGSRTCVETRDPHLTIGSGVVVPKDQVQDFYKKVQIALKDIEPFKLRINNFGFLHYPSVTKFIAKRNRRYVVYLKVKKNRDLMRLVLNIRKVNKSHKKYYRQPWRYYVPHITVAFDDLSREGYIKAKKIWKERMFSAEVTIDKVSIAIAREDGTLIEHKQFSLEGGVA